MKPIKLKIERELTGALFQPEKLIIRKQKYFRTLKPLEPNRSGAPQFKR